MHQRYTDCEVSHSRGLRINFDNLRIFTCAEISTTWAYFIADMIDKNFHPALGATNSFGLRGEQTTLSPTLLLRAMREYQTHRTASKIGVIYLAFQQQQV